jgi:PEP-CTERM motif-containing protein
MMSRHWWVGFSFLLLGVCIACPATAQSPSVIYTWDQSFGEAAGANTEVWSNAFGNNPLTLDNTVDGTLGLTETGAGANAGADWAISDSFNRIKESFNPKDYGGIDFTGLSSLQIDIGHNGPNPVNGQVFAQVGPSSNFKVLGPITVNPGAVATYSVPLTGLAPNEIDALRTIGIQIFGHTGDGNLNWKVNEIRSVGTPLVTRRVADYPVGGPAPAPAAANEGAIFNFDADGFVSGHSAGQNDTGLGFNSVDGALTWTEVPVSGSAPGAAVTWGSGNGVGYYPPTEFAARPVDLSNYNFAKIRLRVQSTVPGEDVDVQYYTQGAGFAYHTLGPDQHITADAQYHTLVFPTAGITDLAETQFHGINLGPHTGTWGVRVDWVEYSQYAVPEPTTLVLLGFGCFGLIGLVRRKRAAG